DSRTRHGRAAARDRTRAEALIQSRSKPMRFLEARRLRLAASGLALTLAMTGAAYADKPARVDHSHPTPAPVYPDSARVAGEHGDVQLGVFVMSGGRPHKVDVTMSSGYQDLDQAAINAVSSYYFTPAISAGHVSTGW